VNSRDVNLSIAWGTYLWLYCASSVHVFIVDFGNIRFIMVKILILNDVKD